MKDIDLSSVEDFLKVESVMMWGLVPANGYRDGRVGIYNGSERFEQAVIDRRVQLIFLLLGSTLNITDVNILNAVFIYQGLNLSRVCRSIERFDIRFTLGDYGSHGINAVPLPELFVRLPAEQILQSRHDRETVVVLVARSVQLEQHGPALDIVVYPSGRVIILLVHCL